MQLILYNPTQRYNRGHCGHAGGIDVYPVGRDVGQGTANPVWHAYCTCNGGWWTRWAWSQPDAVAWSEEHRQTGNRDIDRFAGPLNGCLMGLLLAALAVARIAFRRSVRPARRASLPSLSYRDGLSADGRASREAEQWQITRVERADRIYRIAESDH